MNAVNRARRRYREKGLADVALIYPRILRRHVQSLDQLWGHYVELRGNRATLDGLSFRVDAPGVTTPQKSRFMFDRYERPERLAVKRYLNRRLPVIEFGANIGVVSCLTNRLLTGRPHVVVEPNPDMHGTLEQNRRLNSCDFDIRHEALAYSDGYVRFFRSDDVRASSLRIGRGEPIDVPAITLRALVADLGISRCNVVCDVEGTEVDLVDHELDVIRQHVDALIMEVHPDIRGVEAVERMRTMLRREGFASPFARWSVEVFTRHELA